MTVYSHFSDLELILRDPHGDTKIFPTHRVIVANNSEFFHSLLTGPFHEAQSHARQITVEVHNLDVAQKLLIWMYTKDPYFPFESLDLAQQWLIPSALVNTKDYPGESGTFIRAEGNWIQGVVQTEHHWIKFNSTTLTSLVQNLIIRATSPSDMVVGIEFNWQNVRNIRLPEPAGNSYHELYERTLQYEQAARCIYNYFDIYGLTIKSERVYNGYFSAHTKAEQHTLLKIVLATNTFTDEDREFLMTIWVT